jgi:hypothetical protein
MEFEEQVYDIIANDYNKEELYIDDDITEYELRVQNTINELYKKIAALKGDQCLAAMIKFYGRDR